MKSVSRSLSFSALSLAAACMLLGVFGVQTATAQASPPPIGTWANKTEGLVVMQSGTCGFLVNGRPKWSGTCHWETPSARGGILDLTYPMPLQPGHIRWSVIWVNATTITLDGDVFYKKSN
ncbi:MAG TPA: hypothetical protein VMT38_06155 [Terracidiphilus sp.]|nr:hypothetical protein [Terracidiphilus sp.]